ncbi:MAG: hypothetical protein HQL55_19590 [Magnetococcales bacterium]|nr:hypothetical protein [Magnetococcales bacterium]
MNSANDWIIEPTNLGEVLACAGLAHMAWLMNRQAMSGFTLRDGCCHFVVMPNDLDVLYRLRSMPTGDVVQTGYGLQLAGIDLDWWQPWGASPDMKTWAGRQDETTVHKNLLTATVKIAPADWLIGTAPTTGKLNIDHMGIWNSISLGWSIDEHAKHKMLCRPWLELLASIGLQTFPMKRSKEVSSFKYHLWCPTPLSAAIATFSGLGPSVYGMLSFKAKTDKNGSNKVLKQAVLIKSV